MALTFNHRIKISIMLPVRRLSYLKVRDVSSVFIIKSQIVCKVSNCAETKLFHSILSALEIGEIQPTAHEVIVRTTNLIANPRKYF